MGVRNTGLLVLGFWSYKFAWVPHICCVFTKVIISNNYAALLYSDKKYIIAES